jgi:galactitol-specific phosphotransferase system IIB component
MYVITAVCCGNNSNSSKFIHLGNGNYMKAPKLNFEIHHFKCGYISIKTEKSLIFQNNNYTNHLCDAKIFKTHKEAIEFYEKLLETDYIKHKIKKLSDKELTNLKDKS